MTAPAGHFDIGDDEVNRTLRKEADRIGNGIRGVGVISAGGQVPLYHFLGVDGIIHDQNFIGPGIMHFVILSRETKW